MRLLNVYPKLNLYYFVSGLLDFLKRIDSTVRELHPYDARFMTGVSIEDRKKIFQPYNPTPESIKAISERAHSMLEELGSLKIDKKLLLTRERRMIAKTHHFLRHYFGRPFENNYLAGKFGLRELSYTVFGNVFRIPRIIFRKGNLLEGAFIRCPKTN